MYQKLLSDILAYCRENIEDFDFLESRALRKIDRDRCPLSYASPELYDEMQNAIDDYLMDHEDELDPSVLEDMDLDPETVFWAE